LNFDINLYVCPNLQITVRIRSLGRALSRVIGRVLGREDNRDSDEVLKRRRPTTSTRRQREVVVVAEDAHYMDNAAEEVFQQPEEAVFDAQGFLGEPRDTLVLTAYADHVAVIVWNGETFIVLNKLYFNKYL